MTNGFQREKLSTDKKKKKKAMSARQPREE